MDTLLASAGRLRRPSMLVCPSGPNALEKAQVPDLAIQKAAKGMGLLAIPVWPIIHQGMMAGGIASDSIDVVAQLLPGTGPMPHVRFVMPL